MASRRLVALFDRGSAPGWVPPQEDEPPTPVVAAAASWAPSERGLDEPAPPGWIDRLRLVPSRPAVLGLVVVAVLSALVAAAVLHRARPVEVAVPALRQAGQAVTGASPSPGAEVVVSVVGKVRRPGLVRLPLGARVDDAVRAAGGATAALGLLNVARKVIDGEQILVGVALPAGSAPAGSASTGNGLLDLNAATVAELDDLPGIGPVLAERIVEWRTEHGRFASVDQLREVPGIGESKYLSVKSKVAV